MDEFNPSSDDYISRRNSYNVNVEDAGVALTGHQFKQDDICHFILIGKECRRGVYCKFAHPKPHELGKYKQKIAYQVDEQHRLECYPDQVLSVDVTEIINPVRFYAHLTNTDIDERNVIVKDEYVVGNRMMLFKHIQKCCQSKIDLFGDNHRRQLSEMVVAKLSGTDEWHRGRITGVLENECQVFFVDFGYTELIGDIDIRDMPSELLHVPFQAYECCLAQVELNPAADFQQAINFLANKVKGRNIHGIVTDCKCPDLCLELIDFTNELKIREMMIFKGFVSEITKNEETDQNTADSELLPG